MDQLSTVATWVGLFAGIAGIVLSIVAIVISIKFNDRSNQVSDSTIQALQKIESTVGRLSDDTQGLIKAAWDKMLGGIGQSQQQSTDAARELLSGLSAEMKAELAADEAEGNAHRLQTPEARSAKLDELIGRFERVFERVPLPSSPGLPPSNPVDAAAERLHALSPRALDMIRLLSANGHLERSQYMQLTRDPELKAIIDELRDAGLLVPLRGYNKNGDDVPVYWLPPRTNKPIQAALILIDAGNPRRLDELRGALSHVGYRFRQ